ncbi:hypothetical protein ACS5PN_21910 [Roseateles sp. NT4]|uniref:hypothetical protein n=1 Tax=Roseateles sp. NT4 TaxID=3453715 RepID=UPI003EEABC74
MPFVLLFNASDRQEAVLNEFKSLLPGSEQVRGALVYRDTVLKFEKNPLQGEGDECDLQISAFPLLVLNEAQQQAVLNEVLGALQGLVGHVDVLAEDELR